MPESVLGPVDRISVFNYLQIDHLSKQQVVSHAMIKQEHSSAQSALWNLGETSALNSVYRIFPCSQLIEFEGVAIRLVDSSSVGAAGLRAAHCQNRQAGVSFLGSKLVASLSRSGTSRASK